MVQLKCVCLSASAGDEILPRARIKQRNDVTAKRRYQSEGKGAHRLFRLRLQMLNCTYLVNCSIFTSIDGGERKKEDGGRKVWGM